MMKAGIIGATGYAGVELLRLLKNHPQVEIAAISSESFAGENISAVYPNFSGIFSMVLVDADTVVEKSDCIFASLPHGLSQEIAKKCFEADKTFIDMGADFRLGKEDYEHWYKEEYRYEDLHEKSAYGLCELYREKIKNSRIIGNPGCYPTSAALGLAPAIKGGLIDARHIIIDAKSGVTGAGRGLTLGTHFPECNEAFSAYKIASHRHTPEIERTLSDAAGGKVNITFVPHLLPINRGILSTMYAPAAQGTDLKKLKEAYGEFYRNEQFVRLADSVDIKRVKYSNYCDISLQYDKRTDTVIIISVLDNMVKGAAGQAIQNMNIVYGLSEAEGLTYIPPAF